MGAYISFFGFVGAIVSVFGLNTLYIINEMTFQFQTPKFNTYINNKYNIITVLIIIDLLLHGVMFSGMVGNSFSSEGSKKDKGALQLGRICALMNILTIHMMYLM